MAIKQMNWNKIDSPYPVNQIDKGNVKITPLQNAFGNAKQIVAPRLNVQPIPNSGSIGGE